MTSVAPRISLREPPAPFVAQPTRTARISFVEVDADGPVLRGVGDVGAAVVVVWPTDADGFVDVAAVRRGGARVTTWTLTPGEVAALAALVNDGWPLADHDVLVRGGARPSISPTLRTLRASEYAPRVTDADLRRLTNP